MDKKETTDYFRSNIFEAYGAYNGWKMIMGSKSVGIVSKEMAERYVKIQQHHHNFFGLAERAFLIQFVLLSLHSFDSDDRSFSLYKVNELKTKEFIAANKSVLDSLFDLRNKLFAHRDVPTDKSTVVQYKIPSIIDLDQFFKNLMDFYNQLTSVVDGSSTMFSNAEDIKRDIEFLFMNIYRGEDVRKKEIEIHWSWMENKGKISDIV